MYPDLIKDIRAEGAWPKVERPKPTLTAVHHLDRNPTNNDPSNLVVVPINLSHSESFPKR